MKVANKLNVVSGEVSHREKDVEHGRAFHLLRTNLLLGPPRKPAIALDSEAIAAVSTTEATNTRAQAAKRALLWCLSLLN